MAIARWVLQGLSFSTFPFHLHSRERVYVFYIYNKSSSVYKMRECLYQLRVDFPTLKLTLHCDFLIAIENVQDRVAKKCDGIFANVLKMWIFFAIWCGTNERF